MYESGIYHIPILYFFKSFIQRIALTHGIVSYANFLEQKIILRQKEVKSKNTRVGV